MKHSPRALLTEKGSSIQPDGSLSVDRFLLKDGIVELIRESESLRGAGERISVALHELGHLGTMKSRTAEALPGAKGHAL